MPIENRKPIIFDLFTKVNEDTDPRKLQNGEVARLENAILDKPFGKVKVRGGFVNQSGVSLSASGIEKIINIKDKAGTSYLLGGHTSGIYAGFTSLISTVKTGLSGKAKFAHAQMGDELVISNGTQKPFVLTNAGFATNYNLELPQPQVRNQIIQAGLGGNLKYPAMYKWIWVYVTDTGERSLPSIPFTFGQGVPDNVHNQILFKNLESITDPRIVSKWLYRTEGGGYYGTPIGSSPSITGSVFYLVKKFDPALTYVIDGVADGELDFSESIVFTRVPDKAEYLVSSNSRLFFGGITLEQRYYNPLTYIGQNNNGVATVVNGVSYTDFIIQGMTPRTLAVGQATGLTTASYYRYAVTFFDKDGFESQPIYSNLLLTAGANYTKADLPFLDVSAPANITLGDAFLGSSGRIDINAVGRRVYRTLASVVLFDPEDKPYYLVKEDKYNPLEVNVRVLPVFADTSLDSAISGNRLLTTTNPKTYLSGIAWSLPDRQAYVRLESVTQVFEEDGDPIVGMFDDGNGVLIFKTHSIVKLYHTGAPENWYQRKVWLEHGCDDPKSLLKSGDVYYFQYQKRVYAMPTGGQPQYIGFGKQKTFDLHTIIDVSANDEWLVYATSYSSNYFLLVYDKKIQTWYQFNLGTKVLTSLWFHKYSNALASGTFYAMIDRLICKYDESVSLDSFPTTLATSVIDVAVQFPRINLPDYSPAKIRKMIVDTTRAGVPTITVTSDATTHTAVNLPATLTIERMSGVGNYPASTFFDVLLSGNYQFLNALRVDLRAVRKGVGF